MYAFSMNDENNGKEPITPIAVTNWRDIRRMFGIKQKNRRGHMYIIGKTGTGKSSLMGNMAIADIAQGNGIALVDPHGDLAETLLRHVPERRMKDVIYFNAGDLQYPIAFNPLKKIHPDYHHLVVSGLISVFRKIWSEFWGPRLEHILRHSLLTLLEFPGSTLLDVSRLLTDVDYRKQLVSRITFAPVRSFWLLEFDKYSAWLKSEAVSPILNKMGQFLTSAPLRNIIGQKESSFHLRRVMDEGKILIVNLAKGKIGEDNSTLLGSMFYLAALNRHQTHEHHPRPFYVFVDEFHNFVTLSFADILSEARKYGLNLTLAHQYMDQLHEKIRSAIFGNVGTMISFRVGAEDASYLSREFYPTFGETDFVNLSNYDIYIKLMVNGITTQPFSATTLPLPRCEQSYADQIITESRKRYCRERRTVEQEFMLRNTREETTSSAQRSLFS